MTWGGLQQVPWGQLGWDFGVAPTLVLCSFPWCSQWGFPLSLLAGAAPAAAEPEPFPLRINFGGAVGGTAPPAETRHFHPIPGSF